MRKRLKIGITCYPTVGGSGTIATELGKKLAEKGHEIHFITSGIPYRLNGMHRNIHFHQAEVKQFSVFQYAPYDIALASKMAEVIKREKLDLIHVHYAIPHAVCAILAREMSGEDIRIVTTLHGTDITVLGYDMSLTDAIRFGIERSDKVTAVSKSLVTQTYELIRPDKEIIPIYNFVDERIYRRINNDDLKASLGIGLDEKVIIHVSNFRAVKRVPDVVHTFSYIEKNIPARLLLIGDGAEMRTVRRLADSLGLTGKVLFLGYQDCLEELYSISDLMLLLSEKESFGLALLEAMACGVPGIATNIGGLPEVITDGVNGFICELGNIEEIAGKAMQILTDKDLHRRLSEQAVLTVHNKFMAEFIVGQYENMYYQLVGEGRK